MKLKYKMLGEKKRLAQLGDSELNHQIIWMVVYL